MVWCFGFVVCGYKKNKINHEEPSIKAWEPSTTAEEEEGMEEEDDGRQDVVRKWVWIYI